MPTIFVEAWPIYFYKRLNGKHDPRHTTHFGDEVIEEKVIIGIKGSRLKAEGGREWFIIDDLEIGLVAQSDRAPES